MGDNLNVLDTPKPPPEIKLERSYPPVPWTIIDNWIGLGLFVLIDVAFVLALLVFPEFEFAQNIGLVALQLAYLLPVATVFLWRAGGWKHIGFRKFRPETLALGCGLVIGSYVIVVVHNSILVLLGIQTQADTIMTLFDSLEMPGWFLFVGIILAPFVEEIFFRGFLFQGFREKMGWLKAALLSSAIFSMSHLDPASLIPTFVLGFALAYIFHRSNSLWPGMILHFSINAFGLCAALAMTQFPGLIPS
jgi:membrane protease YdiL (CAAX protease family)